MISLVMVLLTMIGKIAVYIFARINLPAREQVTSSQFALDVAHMDIL